MNRTDESRTKSLPTLIGWLSLCMITAGWISDLGPASWSLAGVFGLTAAWGLSDLERRRALLSEQR